MLDKPAKPIVGKHIFEFCEQVVEPAIAKAFDELKVDTDLINKVSTLENMALYKTFIVKSAKWIKYCLSYA